jgi:hypothetical protein
MKAVKPSIAMVDPSSTYSSTASFKLVIFDSVIITGPFLETGLEEGIMFT